VLFLFILTGEKPFGCNICHRAFAQKEILLRHLMTHSGKKPFECQHCEKSFTQREALKVHMRRHQKLNPNDIQLHHCQLCPKAFCHASGLSRHLVTHTGRTYKCVECEKTFTDKSSLLRHSRIHAPKKLIANWAISCSVCCDFPELSCGYEKNSLKWHLCRNMQWILSMLTRKIFNLDFRRVTIISMRWI